MQERVKISLLNIVVPEKLAQTDCSKEMWADMQFVTDARILFVENIFFGG